jgi:hypothetical protein
MAFDPSKMTISWQQAGGSGNLRQWHFTVSDDDTMKDVQKPGYFSAMAASLSPSSLVYVTAPKWAALFVLSHVDDDWVATVMARADMPQNAAAPLVQGLPQGSAPVGMGAPVTSTGGLRTEDTDLGGGSPGGITARSAAQPAPAPSGKK